ncbi:TadE/TadG family type IV pilus assembly protein [Paraburkholderia lycopersici]|nr:TadE/TadG family type IV pilus assembly protein [Paraburkholderia lycopersici]
MRCRAKGIARSALQRGSAAIEFVVVFPLFFFLLYAIVAYSMVFVVQQSLVAAAEEGARSALVWQYASSEGDALVARGQQACNRATSAAVWLPVAPTCTNAISTAPAGCEDNQSMDCIEVTLRYDYASHPLVPLLPLLDFAVPQSLASKATVEIDPVSLL